MKTEFDKANKDFTDLAHEAARSQVYPHLFQSDGEIEITSIAMSDNSGVKKLDLQYGIDVIVEINVPQLNSTVPVYVQERFRRPKWRDEQDITITRHNNASGKPSELSKIAAQQFIYGYYEPTLGEIQEAICVNVPVLLRKIIDGALLCGEKQNPKKQDFVTIGFDELHKHGATAFHIDRTESTHDPITIDRREDITAYSAENTHSD
jgi:hypothetical protein